MRESSQNKASTPKTRGRPPKYPFGQMVVGESFMAYGDGASPWQCLAYAAAQQYGIRTGRRFSGRKEGDGRVLITRIK